MRFIERPLIADTRGPKECSEFARVEIAKWGDVIRKADLSED